jgi:hypothetical protein
MYRTILLVAAVLAVVAAVAFGLRGTGAPAPTATTTPTATPVVTPAPVATPTSVPTPAPTETPVPSAPADGGPLYGDVRVDLATATQNRVTATVRDGSGDVDAVRSGTPDDGMSVRWHDIAVTAVDDRTIAITWVGMAIDDDVLVAIDANGDGYVVDIVQTAPIANSDATAFDRILLVSFDHPVDPATVTGGVADRSA